MGIFKGVDSVTFFVSFFEVVSFISMSLNTFYTLVIPKFISYIHVLQYLLDISIWIFFRHFKLNTPKRKFIFISLISVNGTTIHLVALIGDIGVVIEVSLTPNPASIRKCYGFYLKSSFLNFYCPQTSSSHTYSSAR